MTEEKYEAPPANAICVKCKGDITKMRADPKDPQEQIFYCPKCDDWYYSCKFRKTKAELEREAEEDAQLKTALDKLLGILIMVKYLGYILFGTVLALVIIGSFLAFTVPFLTEFILAAIILLIIGYAGQAFLTSEES